MDTKFQRRGPPCLNAKTGAEGGIQTFFARESGFKKKTALAGYPKRWTFGNRQAAGGIAPFKKRDCNKEALRQIQSVSWPRRYKPARSSGKADDQDR